MKQLIIILLSALALNVHAATYYVSSVIGNSDANNGSTWTLAKATVAGGLAAATASGDIIYVDSAHVFSSGAAITWDVATTDNTVSIISVNRNGSTTTGHSGWLAGGKETVGVNTAGFTLGSVRAGKMYVYGMYLEGNSGNNAANVVSLKSPTGGTSGCEYRLDSCTLSTPGSSASANISFGTVNANAPGTKVWLKSPTLILRNQISTTQGAINIALSEVFISGATISYAGGTKPQNLIMFGSNPMGTLEIVDSDLSGFNTTSGFFVLDSGINGGFARFINCKLSATPSAAPTGTWPTGNNGFVHFINCDSADTHNNFLYYSRLGTITANSSIYAGSGAVFDGSGISWQIVTTAACSEAEPFVTPWISKWDTSTSAQTNSVELTYDNATSLTDRTAWVDLEYLSNASFPQGTFASTRNVQPFDGSAVNLGSGSATWTGTGGFSSAKVQRIFTGITPAEKSLHRARVSIGAASKTIYLDPFLRIQ